MFKLSDLACVNGERREILRKFTTQFHDRRPADTSTHDFGLMLERDANRTGLTEAKAVFFVMDGGGWLWNIHQNRFSRCSKGILDFYHLSEHLHALAAALYFGSRKDAHRWCGKSGLLIGSGSVESLCSQLQNRLKRTGQFWSKDGFAASLEIIVCYRNGELNSLWTA